MMSSELEVDQMPTYEELRDQKDDALRRRDEAERDIESINSQLNDLQSDVQDTVNDNDADDYSSPFGI
jgi:hypothetical protein